MKGVMCYLNGRWLTSKNNGFVTLYVIMMLSLAIILSGLVYQEIERYHYFQTENETTRVLNWMEVLTINRVKELMRDYHEKDEQYTVNGCTVKIRYDGSTAYITISYRDQIRYRTLIFDDFEECVGEYK